MVDAEWAYARGAADALNYGASEAESAADRMEDAASRYEDALNRMGAQINYASNNSYNPNGSGNHYRYGRGATHSIYDYSSTIVGSLGHYDNHDVFHMIKRYDTGGYTGDWDSNNGRLAILDKK